MTEIFDRHRFLVLTGNYGSGKTEIALNTALGYAAEQRTTIRPKKSSLTSAATTRAPRRWAGTIHPSCSTGRKLSRRW